jgi:hypothetical protein
LVIYIMKTAFSEQRHDKVAMSVYENYLTYLESQLIL